MTEQEKQRRIEEQRGFFMRGLLTADELAESVAAIINGTPRVWVLTPTQSERQWVSNV